ncbi:MAG: hypothetical protein QOH31_6952 [Verrucomicrobiota bacterium]|jgi:hypothetical protein
MALPETAVAFVWQRLEFGLSVISAAGAILAFMALLLESFQGLDRSEFSVLAILPS